MEARIPLARDALTLTGRRPALSEAFREALSNSPNALIVVVHGCPRVGKSLRLNQFVTGDIGASAPFAVDQGATAVTAGAQFHRCPLSRLCRLHRLPFTGTVDPDVFFIDTEGDHDLEGITAGMRAAFPLLWDIATANLIVNHGRLNHRNSGSVKDLLVAASGLPEAIPGFHRSSIIIEGKVGIPERADLTDEECEIRRREQNANRRRIIADLFNREIGPGTLPTVEDDRFQVFAEPRLDNRELYMNSIRDVIALLLRLSNGRRVITGRELVDRFDLHREIFLAGAEHRASLLGAIANGVVMVGRGVLGLGMCWNMAGVAVTALVRSAIS
jgi:hypothetical protein